MTSKTETALLALVDALDATFGPKSFPRVNRNEALDDVLKAMGGAAGGAYVNVVDGQGEVNEQFLGAEVAPEIEGYEILHHSNVEIFVCQADQVQRDATFDALLEAVAEAIETDRTLGGFVSDTQFEAPDRNDFKEDGLPVIKSATLTVTMTFFSARPF